MPPNDEAEEGLSLGLGEILKDPAPSADRADPPPDPARPEASDSYPEDLRWLLFEIKAERLPAIALEGGVGNVWAMPSVREFPRSREIILEALDSSHVYRELADRFREGLAVFPVEQSLTSAPVRSSVDPQAGEPVHVPRSRSGISTRTVIAVGSALIVGFIAVLLLVLRYEGVLFSAAGDEKLAVVVAVPSVKTTPPASTLPGFPALGSATALQQLEYELSSLPTVSPAAVVEVTRPSADSPRQERVVLQLNTELEPESVRKLRINPEPLTPSKVSEMIDGHEGKTPPGLFPESPTPSGELVTFAQPQSFRLVHPTNIRTGPSAADSVIERLDAGSLVSVRGTRGRWLRVVDEQGRQGWIRAADAEPVSDDSLRGPSIQLRIR